VERPEEYRWSPLGYHIQTGNKDDFLSLDFGPVKYASLSLRELHKAGLKEFGVLDPEERLKGYRRYVYEAGALNRPEKGQAPEECASLSQVSSTGQAPEECASLSQVSSTGQTKVINNATLKKERHTPVKSAALVFCEELNGVKNYEISRADRFRYRTRYFADSGIIGTK